MNNANFLAKENFPQSTYTFDFLQNMIKMAGSLALLGGDNFILSGCADDGKGMISEGLIVINGQLYPFAGGAKKAKIKIQETGESDHYAGVDYPEAYIHRKVIFADDGDILWDDLKQVLTNKELEQRISSIKGDTPGTVKMWVGYLDKIPTNYRVCNGDFLSQDEYPELFQVIGTIHGTNAQTNFALPDMRQMFIVGYDNRHDGYNEIGKTGGAEKVTLKESELPPHKHIMPWGENLNTSWQPKWDYPNEYFNNSRGYKADTDNDNTWPYTSPIGDNEAHENRPPFFVVAYIMKVKY